MGTVTTYLCASPCSEAISFYERAFGAVEKYRIANPDGRLGHAEIAIGDTTLMLSDEWEEGGVFSPLRNEGHSISLVIEVDDADAVIARAVELGARVTRSAKEEPYGYGGWVADPFGYHWNIFKPNPDFDPSTM